MDQEKANAFAERMLGILNNASLSLMTSVGHRTHLFDTLAEMQRATSAELAEQAGLKERYVREWLGALTTGKIIEYDPNSKQYRLPEEHQAFLTRKAKADNIALFTQYIAMMGQVEDDVVECFRKGGGVPYSRYARFHEVMAEESEQSAVHALSQFILPLVPGLVDRLKKGIEVVDLGCGSGRALNLMAERFPASRFTGFDLSEEGISRAKKEASEKKLANINFVVRDLSHFDEEAEPERFDFATTFDAVHDQARPQSLLRGIYRTLKPGGVYLMQDIRASSNVENNLDHPLGPFLYSVSTFHCMTVSLSQGGEGLGTMWGREKATEMLKITGFVNIEVHQLPHDIQNDYYINRK